MHAFDAPKQHVPKSQYALQTHNILNSIFGIFLKTKRLWFEFDLPDISNFERFMTKTITTNNMLRNSGQGFHKLKNAFVSDSMMMTTMIRGTESQLCPSFRSLSRRPSARKISAFVLPRIRSHSSAHLGSGKDKPSVVSRTWHRAMGSTTSGSCSGNEDSNDLHRYRYTLYQYKICPFSNIAKVYLTYHRIPFESVEVNPLTKQELGFSKDYRKVPIVTILDTDPHTPANQARQQLNGTEEILVHKDPDNDFSSSPLSLQWQDFARTKLATLLYPNLCKTLGDSFRAFDYVHSEANHFSGLQKYSIQYIGSLAMYFAASKIQKKYQIQDVEAALEDSLRELESQLSKGGPFLTSESLSLGDLAVFGVLKGLEGLPLWHRIFVDSSSRFPKLKEWYLSVDQRVAQKEGQTKRYSYND